MICTARIASAGFIGRIDTTSGPWNGPGRHRSQSRCGTSARCSRRSCGAARCRRRSAPASNENEQPIAKVTRSSRHQRMRSIGSSTTSPFAPDPVARQIGADVEIIGRATAARQSPGAETPTSGHGFGLSWQKRRKSSASALRQDGEIGLHEARRQSRGRPGMLVAPDRHGVPRRPVCGGCGRPAARIVAAPCAHACFGRANARSLPILSPSAGGNIPPAAADDVAATMSHAGGVGSPPRPICENLVETTVKIAFANATSRSPRARQGPASRTATSRIAPSALSGMSSATPQSRGRSRDD